LHTDNKAFLVDGKYGIRDLVDIAELRRIFQCFHDATGFTVGFLDHPGLDILIDIGWLDICTKFHRDSPIAAENCRVSNRALLDNLDKPGKLVIECCKNGLVDCAFPIIIKGKHIASLATGQLLLKEPDIEQFKQQARLFGFKEEEYLRALAEVPVVPEDKLRSVTTFLGEMALVISQMGYARLGIIEEAEHLEKEIAVRKEAEEALVKERELLLVTLRSIGDGVITTDTSGRVVLMNKVAEDLTGWLLAESTGRPLSEVFNTINEETREPCRNPIDNVLRDGQIAFLPDNTILVARDGTERFIADSGAAIKGGEGKTLGVVLVFRDISNRQKSEKALKNAERIQSLGSLAGGIAHDFNNYLAGILGHVDLAHDSLLTGDTKQAINELNQLASVVKKARNLTQRLQTFSKGEMPVLKLGSLIEVVREIADFSVSGSNIAVEFSASQDLPACSFDANQIAQVVQNLVLNAKEAMPGGGTIKVSIGTAVIDDSYPVLSPGKYLKVTVSDSGKGIPTEIIPLIFDPFFTTKTTGTGLGLSICYSIVEKHNGHIEVMSQPGDGSEFIFYLPEGTSTVPQMSKTGSEVRHQGHGDALVMDDEDFIRDITSSMLQRLGYTTTTARNGEEALKLMEGTTFQLVVLDLTVPGGMGGIEAIREIRRKYGENIKVIAATGYSEAQVVTDPEQFGFDGSIAKPFTMLALELLLNNVMSS